MVGVRDFGSLWKVSLGIAFSLRCWNVGMDGNQVMVGLGSENIFMQIICY